MSHLPQSEISKDFTKSTLSRPDNKQNRCRTGEECEELCLRTGSLLACGVMCFVSSSFFCVLMHMIRLRKYNSLFLTGNFTLMI